MKFLMASPLDDLIDGTRGEPVILLGDLNDHLDAVTTSIVSGEEPAYYLRRDVKQRAWDVLLYSAHDLQEERSYRNVSFTPIHDGHYELLDYVFVSQEFVRQFPNGLGK